MRSRCHGLGVVAIFATNALPPNGFPPKSYFETGRKFAGPVTPTKNNSGFKAENNLFN
jgi:hypothetical protein